MGRKHVKRMKEFICFAFTYCLDDVAAIVLCIIGAVFVLVAR